MVIKIMTFRNTCLLLLAGRPEKCYRAETPNSKKLLYNCALFVFSYDNTYSSYVKKDNSFLFPQIIINDLFIPHYQSEHLHVSIATPQYFRGLL